MPLNAEFLEVSESMRVPSMGTEHAALLLYSLVVMLRPQSVLEIGAGYSTLFMARALADARQEACLDRELLSGGQDGDDRARILSHRRGRDYQPTLFVIDDLRHPKSSASRVAGALRQLGLSDFVSVINSDFRGASARLPASALPLDLVWFDCGAAGEAGVPFFEEYWPLVRDGGGTMAIHSLLVPLRDAATGLIKARVPSPLLNELRKRQADSGRQRKFELINLAEPHKVRQGDVTLLSKTGGFDLIRESSSARTLRLQV